VTFAAFGGSESYKYPSASCVFMAKVIPKFGTHEQIQFVGVNELAIEEQALVSKLSTEHYEKLSRKLKGVEQMTVHVKHYEKTGGKRKFSLHVRLKAPTRAIIESCAADDFDLARALHKAFEDIGAQIEHRFHTGTYNKSHN
jgi:hypothetical protein